MSVVEALVAAASERPGDQALVDDAGVALCYGEWLRRSRVVAAALRAVADPGSRVVLAFANADVLDYAAAFHGTLGAGMTAVPVALPAPARAVDDTCTAAGATLVVSAQPVGCATRNLVVDAAAPGRAAELSPCADDFALAQILFSSGTTGVPKAIAVPHGNLAAVAQLAAVRDGARRPRLLHWLPIGTSAFQNQLLRAIALDYGVHVLRMLDPRRVLRMLAGGEVSSLLLVPASASLLLEAGGDAQFPGVESIGTTGSFFRAGDFERLARMFPRASITTSYGSTEAAPAGTSGPFDPARPLAVGRPNAGCDLRVTDEGGDPLPAGGAGVIWLRARGVPTRTYLDDGELSARTFRDGWTRMGDFGHIDADGSLVLAGRASDVISVGGMKVSGPEVEAVIAGHPAVRDCSVVGEPHPILGQRVTAEIVTRGPLDSTEIIAYLRERLPRYKVPTTIRLVADVPRNAMGKRPRQPADPSARGEDR